MLKHRLLYGGSLLIVFVTVEVFDITQSTRIGTSILISLFSLIATFEYHDMMRRGSSDSCMSIGLGGAALFLGLTIFAQSGASLPVAPLEIGVVLLILMTMAAALLGKDAAEMRFQRMATTLFGFAYIALPTWCFLEVVTMPGPPDGLRLFFWAVLVVKSTDMGAYFVGGKMGKTKLSPLSPNKSWEGAIGGALVAVTIGGILALVILDIPMGELPRYLGIALAISTVGQLGDLAESGIKRGVGVKDSGRYLPGIGGILDSIDSVLPVAPVFLLLLRL